MTGGRRRSTGSSPSRGTTVVGSAIVLLATVLLASCGTGPIAPIPSTATSTGPPVVTDAAGGLEIGADATPAIVVRVIDGDSLVIDEGASELEVRLFGINAPETDECLGDRARKALARWEGRPVEALGVDRDQYGRTVVLLWAEDGTWISEALVRSGMAVTLVGASEQAPPRAISLLIDAQAQAHGDEIGLWAEDACNSTTARPDVEIEMSAPDPPGPDGDDLDAEYVTIVNIGTRALDLSGWTLRDESTANRFEFPTGTRVEPDTSLVVTSGCESGGNLLGWCGGAPIWNNGGDSAFLLDANGRIVATARYVP